MIAHKFLARGAVSPFTGLRWPQRGEWVAGPVARREAWVHACRQADLPYWLDDELWRVELDGPVLEDRYQIASPRARLVARVGAWNPVFAGEYAAACALRARDVALPHLEQSLRDAIAGRGDLGAIAAAARRAPSASHVAGYLADSATYALRGEAATASYIGCVIASVVGGGLGAFEAERGWQARWLGEQLGLDAAPRAGAT
jgi:hypothetical protein